MHYTVYCVSTFQIITMPLVLFNFSVNFVSSKGLLGETVVDIQSEYRAIKLTCSIEKCEVTGGLYLRRKLIESGDLNSSQEKQLRYSRDLVCDFLFSYGN